VFVEKATKNFSKRVNLTVFQRFLQVVCKVSRLWNDAVLKFEQEKEIYFFFKMSRLVFAKLAFYSMGKGRSFPRSKSVVACA
jgi:hypothetical protein